MLLTRSQSRRKNSSGGLSETLTTLPSETVSSDSSLDELRCNTYAQPPHDYFRSLTRWYSRLTNAPEDYPNTELGARLEEIGPELGALKIKTTRPPQGTTPEEWRSWHLRRLKLEGQVDAIGMVLDTRSRLQPKSPERRLNLSGGSGSAPTSRPLTSTAAPAWDPFADE